MLKQFNDYARRWPGESVLSAEFSELLSASGALAFSRERLTGHFTASAWLVDRTGDRVLLTHHRGLNRWFQLGGHADGNQDLAAVALIEAEEESGLQDLAISSEEIFDLDKHWIPDSPRAAGHWHYDVRYVVSAGQSEVFTVSEESIALAWRRIDELADDPIFDDSMRRMAWKWQLQRCENGQQERPAILA